MDRMVPAAVGRGKRREVISVPRMNRRAGEVGPHGGERLRTFLREHGGETVCDHLGRLWLQCCSRVR